MSVMITFPKIQRQKARGGVSLLEILICVGILSIGLLGVAALIPAGHFAVVETTKADRSVACAKAAKAQVQVRGMLNPEEWQVWNSTSYSYDTLRPTAAYSLYGSTIVIDPLGVATAEGAAEPRYFPCNQFLLWRFTIDDFLQLGTITNDIRIKLCERTCRWSDDITLDVDDTDPDLRPRQTFTSDDPTDNFGPYPTRLTDDTPIAGDLLLRETEGNYSWFLTVTPDLTEAFLPVDQMKTFSVSTVICYKRDLSFDTTVNVPAERRVFVDLDPASFSGIAGAGASDIPLAMEDGTTDINEYLEVKPGQWILLVGTKDITDSTGATYTARIAKWYRVLSVDDELDDKTRSGARQNINFSNTKTAKGQIRWVTVTGPEWMPGANPGEIDNTQAIIVDSVIGVFTETMTLDR